MPKYSELKGKTVIVKSALPPIVGTIEDVEEEGIWIKTQFITEDDNDSPGWKAAVTAASTFKGQVVFIPLGQIQILVTSADWP
jgi:hypothetical protein